MGDKKPLKTYRHGGKDRNVQAAIWENESRDGSRKFLNVTFGLQYKEGDEWKDTTSFGAGDIYNLMRCATDAAAFCFFHEVREKRELEQAA